MLLELSVENIAIIESARIQLGQGFTALTGETGAGKSLLIDAISLALGGRADSDLVRTGAQRGIVTLAADLRDNPNAKAVCEELGATLDEDVLYIQREVSAEGRSSCRIGGKLVPVHVLRQIGELLVDLHGQHDHQSLLHAESHLQYLDAWIGSPAVILKLNISAQKRTVDEMQSRQNSLELDLRTREQRLDILRFQAEEIGAAQLEIGEFDRLEAESLRLRNADYLARNVQECIEVLDGEEGGALLHLSAAIRSLETIQAFDPTISQLAEALRSSLFVAEDTKRELRLYGDAIDSEPRRIEEIADRLEVLRKLKRKYGDDEVAILQYLAEVESELEALRSWEESSEQLTQQLADANAELTKLASELSKIRKTHAKKFCALVQDQLRELAMEKAKFETHIEACPICESGGDSLQFMFSANSGEPVKALSKIASGGELSRVMLALKVALAGKAGVPTLIFDEVDAGLSGRAAAVVAKKLTELATHCQVLVISHLPQIASQATTHFRIEKVDTKGRVLTQVRELDRDERIAEIARLLAGETVGDSALQNAKELLKTAYVA